MPKNYPTVMHEWFDQVWNEKNAAAIDRLLAADAVVHGITDASGKELRGPPAFREFHRQFLEAFPNVTVEVADTVSEGDRITGRCIVRGRHDGGGLGMPATQRNVEFTGMCIARVKDGKIVEAWNNFDFLTMHTQLGTLETLRSGPANAR